MVLPLAREKSERVDVGLGCVSRSHYCHNQSNTQQQLACHHIDSNLLSINLIISLTKAIIMKAHRSSSFIAILLVMSVFNLPLTVRAAQQGETAATLRGNAVVGQEHRILAKGGNGGGGGGGGQNKNNESITPAPTASPTPAQTTASTPAPSPIYPVVDPASCGTRPPTSLAPSTSLAPTPPTAQNCAVGCNKKTPCACDGWTCNNKSKTCVEPLRRNLRVEQAKSFPFQTSVADASRRKLNTCTSEQCNINNNEPMCGSDIPVIAFSSPSIICNYEEATTGDVMPAVDPCDSNSSVLDCCEDGNGGFYKPTNCWPGSGYASQCCPKGYFKSSTYNNGACFPLNCCDAKDEYKALFCPNC